MTASQIHPGPAVRHVAIAGGGIGGLTLACALQRAGIGATVYERAPELLPVGAGITVQANAMAALRTLGLDAAVAAAGARAGASAILDAAGRTLQSIDMREVERAVGAPIVCIHRARLHRVLLDACGAAGVRTGCEVRGYEEGAAGVRVQLADGSAEDADLLVGADGIRSAVRARLLGEAPLRYAGYTSWRGICRDEALASTERTSESWGAGARFGIVPIGNGEIYWFATANAPEGEPDPPGKTRERLLEIFGGWHAPIAALIERTDPSEILRTDIHDRAPVKRWSRGRVVLLGDAAHPMTPNLGQGGCQAIEDAVILARSLASHGSPGEALRAYERLRVARANGIVAASWRLGRVGQIENRTGRFLRDALFRLMPQALARRQIEAAMRFEPGPSDPL